MSDLTSNDVSSSGLLSRQLDLVWLFADAHVLPRITEKICHWRPGDNTLMMRRTDQRWSADWPDESVQPLPEPTVGWLLWHIEWWWNNALQVCAGDAAVGPESHQWSGSVEGVRWAKSRWSELLRITAPEAVIEGLMPEPSSFGFVAAWVNFELTKNLSEIGQLVIRHENAVNRRPRGS